MMHIVAANITCLLILSFLINFFLFTHTASVYQHVLIKSVLKTSPLDFTSLTINFPIPLLSLQDSFKEPLTRYLNLLSNSLPVLSLSSVQSSSATQSCPTLCDPMNHSTPGFPVHHQLPEFTQTHVHRVIQPSHPVVPFSSCPQSLPASESFPMSQLFG